jgi:monovalent cation:H+ antiporter-2, CPA2 family
MAPNPVLFGDLTYIFLAAVAGGLIAWRLRLPLILGFVGGGIVISPFTPGPHLSDPHSFEVFAEVGVALLMFSIGVEFSIPDLMRVKRVALIGGPIGIVLMVGLAVAAAKITGWGVTQGIVIGGAVSVASTMVLARLLSDSAKLGTTFGRVMIGITLVEDLAVIFMTVALPLLGSWGVGQIVNAAWTLGKALLLLIPLILFAIKVIPHLLTRAKQTNNPELFRLVAIAICLGTAALASAVGFSVALGAFLAGLSIGASEDLQEVHTQLVPLRDAFVALFFVSLGTLIAPRLLAHNLPLVGTMLLLIVIGKFVVWMIVVRLFRYPLTTAIAVASGLTQIGELSFVLVQVAWSAGMVADNVISATVAASVISILVNVFFFRGVLGWIARRLPVADAVVA